MLRIAILFAGGYLIGNFLTAMLVARLAGKGDLRNIGSRNPGTSNVFMTIGAGWGVATFLGDAAKALIPLLIARYVFHLYAPGLMALAVGVILGHDFPVFYRFKGGKGTACLLATSFGLHWIVGVVVLVTLLAVAIATNRLAIGAVVASVAMPVSLYFTGFGVTLAIVAIIIPVISLVLHRSNIRKIMDGTEPYLIGAVKNPGKFS